MTRNTSTANRILYFLLRVEVLVVFVVLFLPIIIVAIFSLDGSPIPLWPLNDVTLKWYGQLISGPYSARYMNPLVNSLYVGFLTGIVATAFGTLAGFAMSRYRFPGARVFPFVIATPAMVPPLISGFGILILLRQMLNISLSLYTVVLGHVALTMPFAAFIVAGKLGPEEKLERAARDLGAGYYRTFREVTLPLVGPAIVASILLAFTISLGESAMVFLLKGSQPLLPVLFDERMKTTVTPRFNSISTILIVITFGLFTVAEIVRQRVNS